MLIYLRNQIVIILLLCFSQVGYAAVIDGVFKSSVEVQSNQSSDRQSAFNEALIKTLLKLSGDKRLVTDSVIYERFFPAERFVQSFSYEENKRYLDYVASQRSALNEQVTGNSSAFNLVEDEQTLLLSEGFDTSDASQVSIPLQYLLNVDFSPEALTKEMKNLGLPVWGNVRPNIMLWGIVESEGERDLIGIAGNNDLLKVVSDIADNYALPVSFPQADGIDKELVSMSGLWGLFPDSINEAKKRYSANGNVMVRFYQSVSGLWSANWLFQLNELTYAGSVQNSSLKDVSDNLVSFMAKILSERFSIQVDPSTAENNTIYLEVSNINTFKDYVDLQSFLSGLTPVKSFSISSLEGPVISLLVELNSSSNQFNEYLSLSGKFKYIETSSVTAPTVNRELDLSGGQSEIRQSSIDVSVISESPIMFLTSIKVVEKYKWLFSSVAEK